MVENKRFNLYRSRLFYVQRALLLLTAGFLPFNKLPLGINIIGILIGLLCVTLLVDGGFKDKSQQIKMQPTLLLPPLLFIAYLFGLLYTEHLSLGGQVLERKLTFFLLPLIVGSSRLLHRKGVINRLLASFVIGTLACLLIAIGLAVAHAPFSLRSLQYEQFTHLVNLHPTYLSMYASLSVFILWKFMLERNKRIDVALLAIGITFLSISIFLIASKGAIIAFILSHLLLLPLLIKKYGNRKTFLGTATAIGVTTLLLLAAPFTAERFLKLTNKNNSQVSIRTNIWEIGSYQYLEAPLLGYGTGDVQPMLNSAYKTKGLFYLLSTEFNAHNQTLQIALALGIVGIFIWALLFVPLIKKHTSFLFRVFLLLVFINALFESLLEVQAGILFFAFFYPIFVLHQNDQHLSCQKNSLLSKPPSSAM